jgi:hypothetical protein
MDRLEEHIRKNREDLDIYNPSSGIWKNISRRLKKEKLPVNQWLSIAAMIVVILGTAVLFFKLGNRRMDISIEKSSNSRFVQENPQLKETEIYYNNLVNSLYREATPLLTGNPEIEKELDSDLSQLDSICLDIKKDLRDNVANQDVVEALIQNYRIKIRLLEDMLTILKEEKNDQEKSKSHEL